MRALAREGLNISQIAREVGVSRPTVRTWLARRQKRSPQTTCTACGHARHDFDALPAREYSYLLGVYLGDGMISPLKGKRCFRLRIFMDVSYPKIIREVVEAMRATMPSSSPRVQHHLHKRSVEIYSYSNAWKCLFPQHGPGPKHLRRIELAPWQQAIAEREPEQLIRGLIHSDGCRVTNRVVVAGKEYAYPRYFFTQVSKDIQRIFCEALERAGIEYRYASRGRDVSIARAGSVARLDSFVGPKT